MNMKSMDMAKLGGAAMAMGVVAAAAVTAGIVNSKKPKTKMKKMAKKSIKVIDGVIDAFK